MPRRRRRGRCRVEERIRWICTSTRRRRSLRRHGIPINSGRGRHHSGRALSSIAREAGGAGCRQGTGAHRRPRQGRGCQAGTIAGEAAREAAAAILGHRHPRPHRAQGACRARRRHRPGVLSGGHAGPHPPAERADGQCARAGSTSRRSPARRPDRIVRALVDPLIGLHAWQARAVGFALGMPADKVQGFANIALRLYDTYHCRRRHAGRDQSSRPDRDAVNGSPSTPR